MCEYAVELAEVWVERRRAARRGWACSVCREPIAAGRVYMEVSSLSDGKWARDRLHTACMDFAQSWQLDVCGQSYWVVRPESTPHAAVLEHIEAGDIPAAEGAAIWREWLRARGAL